MRQYAWPEHYEGVWYLLTDVAAGSAEADRKWTDHEEAPGSDRERLGDLRRLS